MYSTVRKLRESSKSTPRPDWQLSRLIIKWWLYDDDDDDVFNGISNLFKSFDCVEWKRNKELRRVVSPTFPSLPFFRSGPTSRTMGKSSSCWESSFVGGTAVSGILWKKERKMKAEDGFVVQGLSYEQYLCLCTYVYFAPRHIWRAMMRRRRLQSGWKSILDHLWVGYATGCGIGLDATSSMMDSTEIQILPIHTLDEDSTISRTWMTDWL